MANIKIATIINHQRIDADVLDAAVAAGDTIQIQVENEYVDAPAVLINYDDAPLAYKDAIREAIDYTTYQYEDPAYVWKVGLDSGTHTMDGYYRTGIPSSGTVITTTKKLVCVFIIAWLNAKDNLLELPLTLAVGTALDSNEVSDLAAKGITVSGDSDSFTIASTTPYKLQCVKPPLETDTYVIDHAYDINEVRS